MMLRHFLKTNLYMNCFKAQQYSSPVLHILVLTVVHVSILMDIQDANAYVLVDTQAKTVVAIMVSNLIKCY